MQPATLHLSGQGDFVSSSLDMHYFLLTTEMAAKLAKLTGPGVVHHDLTMLAFTRTAVKVVWGRKEAGVWPLSRELFVCLDTIPVQVSANSFSH